MTTDSPDDRRPLARPRCACRIGRIAFLVVAAIVVIAVAAAFFVTWTIQRSFPQTDGALHLDGLQAEVTVQRDDRGIPTITADSTDDLFYAEGFVHAQDRFFEMDFRRHVTAGRVAEMFGESQAATDAFLRTLGWRTVAEAEVAAMDDGDPRLLRGLRRRGQRLPRDRAPDAELSLEYAVLGHAESRLRARALGARGFGRLARRPWPGTSAATSRTRPSVRCSPPSSTAARVRLQLRRRRPLLEKLYPAYPFDEIPVIVPKISTVPDAGTDADARSSPTTPSDAEHAARRPPRSSGRRPPT